MMFFTSTFTTTTIQNVIDGSQDLEIRNNLIEKIADGIFLRNVGNINLNPSNVSDIFDNEIKFGVIPNTATGFYYGIRLENSIGFSITNNVISKQNPVNPDANVVDNLRGISLSKSPNNIVADNTITKMGAGIRALGSCPASTFACNYLDKNYHGFYFDGSADIGDQLFSRGNFYFTIYGFFTFG